VCVCVCVCGWVCVCSFGVSVMKYPKFCMRIS